MKKKIMLTIGVSLMVVSGMQAPTGKVKFFNTTKRFGFITDDDTGEDVFVHQTNAKDTIKEGDSVTYEAVDGKKGPQAENVRLA